MIKSVLAAASGFLAVTSAIRIGNPETCSSDLKTCSGLDSFAAQLPDRPKTCEYHAEYTQSANYNYGECTFTLCPNQEVEISTCGEGGSWHNGDTFLRLYDGNGYEVAYSDDSCGVGSRLKYTVPAGVTECMEYSIHEGCFQDNKCGAKVAIRVKDIPFMCPFYYASYTWYANYNYGTCGFTACGGETIKISSCDAESYGPVFYWLLDGNDYASNSNRDARGCAVLEYHVEGDCREFSLHEGCDEYSYCYASLSVYGGHPLPQTASPTMSPTNEELPGEYRIHGNVSFANYTQVNYGILDFEGYDAYAVETYAGSIYPFLQWSSNAYVLDAVNYGQPSGYPVGVVTPVHTLYNGYGSDLYFAGGDSMLIAVYGFFVASAWDNQTLTVTGFDEYGNQEYQFSVPIFTNRGVYVDFEEHGALEPVKTVLFHTTVSHFSMDNIEMSAYVAV